MNNFHGKLVSLHKICARTGSTSAKSKLSALGLHRQIQNNEKDGSNDDNNYRPEEADFENNGVGIVSQVDDRSARPRTAEVVQELQGWTKNHTPMRLMLDTCVIIDLLTDAANMEPGVRDLLSDRSNQFFACAE